MRLATRPASTAAERRPDGPVGAAYAASAFLFWGMSPIYFKAIGHVDVFEVMAHRVIWSVALLGLLIVSLRRGAAIRYALSQPRTLKLLVASTLLITVNWTVFVWAISAERVLEVSLGYYVNPLVSVLLGLLVLGERLDRWQWLAVLLAATGVANLALQHDGFPWVSLALAFSFGFYGLIRKRTALGSAEGLLIETTLMLPFAAAFVGWLWSTGRGSFLTVSAETDLLLVAAGAVTALPLVWFASAARRLQLSTIGFFQYLAPSCQFLLAVLVYEEPFTEAHLVTFILIWGALVIFTARGLHGRRR